MQPEVAVTAVVTAAVFDAFLQVGYITHMKVRKGKGQKVLCLAFVLDDAPYFVRSPIYIDCNLYRSLIIGRNLVSAVFLNGAKLA